MRLHAWHGATRKTHADGLGRANKALCLDLRSIMVPDQLLFLVEEMSELSEQQGRLLRHLQEVPTDGIAYEECRREAEAINRACLQLLQRIRELSGGVATVN
jgi:hypothetical protein